MMERCPNDETDENDRRKPDNVEEWRLEYNARSDVKMYYEQSLVYPSTNRRWLVCF